MQFGPADLRARSTRGTGDLNHPPFATRPYNTPNGTLENRKGSQALGGSNPSPSAKVPLENKDFPRPNV